MGFDLTYNEVAARWIPQIDMCTCWLLGSHETLRIVATGSYVHGKRGSRVHFEEVGQ